MKNKCLLGLWLFLLISPLKAQLDIPIAQGEKEQITVGKKMVHKVEHKTEVIGPSLRLLINRFYHRVLTNQNIVYTIKVINSGRASGSNVIVTNTLAENVVYTRSFPKGIFKPARGRKPATITWKFKEIPRGIKFIQVYLEAKKQGNCTNIVKLSSDNVKMLVAKINIQIAKESFLQVRMFDTEDPCNLGEQTVYVVEVNNPNDTPCTNIRLLSTLSSGIEFLNADSGKYRWNAEMRSVIFDPHRVLQPREKLMYKVYCMPTEIGTIGNKVRIKYDQSNKFIFVTENSRVRYE